MHLTLTNQYGVLVVMAGHMTSAMGVLTMYLLQAKHQYPRSDTEVYATGKFKSTPIGAIARFAAAGARRKKILVLFP